MFSVSNTPISTQMYRRFIDKYVDYFHQNVFPSTVKRREMKFEMEYVLYHYRNRVITANVTEFQKISHLLG